MPYSLETEDLLFDLVSWEFMARTDIEPRSLLKQLDNQRLLTIVADIDWRCESVRQCVSLKMIHMEGMFRAQKLIGDWSYLRDGKNIILRYRLKDGEQKNTQMKMQHIFAELR